MFSSLLLCLACLLGLAAGEEEIVCSPQKTFPHPEDCVRYYYCDNTNTPQVFYCSPGLHFNPGSQQCDLPESSPCPLVPGAGQASATTLLGDSQPSDSSPTVGEGLVVGHSFVSLPDSKKFYTPELQQPSAPSFIEVGQTSDSSFPGDEGPVVRQLSSPSLPNTSQFYTTPDLRQPSLPSLLDLEQPSTPGVVANQSFVPVFPGRGGPIFRQPEVEDRKDDVGEVVYENKPENTSESFGTFFRALNNFEKTLEEGRRQEEGDVTSEFVDVKRQAPADDISVSPSFSLNEQPMIIFGKEEGNEPIVVYGKEEVNTESNNNEGTSESIKTEGRCSADSDFFARKAPTDTSDITFTSEKAEESTTSGGVNKFKTDVKSDVSENNNTSTVVWPLFPITNLTVVNEESDNGASKTLDYPTVKSIEVEPQNLTEEEKSTFKYPSFTALNINETSPLQHTETGAIETFEEKKEANEDKTPEKVEEIEEAKGTIIFESHSAEEEKEKDEVPEGLTKVVLEETGIL